MLIQFTCPHCEGSVSVSSEYGGQAGRCPSCHETVTIPGRPAPSSWERPRKGGTPRLRSVALPLVELVIFAAIALALWECWRRPCYQLSQCIVMAFFVGVGIALLAGLFGSAVGRRLGGSVDGKTSVAMPTFWIVLLIGLPLGLISFSVDKSLEAWDRVDAPEYQNLSYARYAAVVGDRPFVPSIPEGSSHIYAKWGWGRKFSFWFLKATIPAAAHETLLAEMAQHASTLPLGPVRQRTRARPEIPPNWPPPRSAPDWWQPEQSGPNVQATLWESQTQDENPMGSGWYLARDLDTNTVWMWSWKEHHDFGWEADSVP